MWSRVLYPCDYPVVLGLPIPKSALETAPLPASLRRMLASTLPAVSQESTDYLPVGELVGGMEVELRCYGGVRSAVGRKAISWKVEPGTTVGELLDELVAESSEINPSELVVMRDRSHLPAEHELADGDVLSISTVPMRE